LYNEFDYKKIRKEKKTVAGLLSTPLHGSKELENEFPNPPVKCKRHIGLGYQLLSNRHCLYYYFTVHPHREMD
jgi:hypothetical protein